MWFTVLAGFVAILLFMWYNFFSSLARMKKLTARIPGPKGYPIIGCAFEFGTTSDEIFQAFLRITKNHGKVVSVWVGPVLYVILSDVKDIEAVMSSNKLIEKADVYDLLDPWLGRGLLSSTGDLWRKQRKILTPAFHFKILEQFIDVFNYNTDILIEKLTGEVGKPGFDVVPHVVLCTLDIISESSMGTKINAQKDKDNKFVSAIHDIAFAVLYRALKPWLFPDSIFRMSSIGKQFYKQLVVVHTFIQEVITTKRKEKEEKKKSGTNENEKLAFGQKKRSVFLDILLDYNDNGIGLPDDEIRNEVNTFMFAGHDTTTSGITFAIYALMKNPAIQENIIKEMSEIFQDKDTKPTYQDLQDMKYLECVIKESQRMYPSVPYIGRRLTKDFTLPSGYTIPAGGSLNLFLYGMHHNPEYFPEPDVFYPDRFTTEGSTGRHPFAFCPFSAGPRNCIGQKFAMLEMKAVISTIVRKFKILPPVGCPDIILGSELVLRSTTGVNVKLEYR